MSTTPMITCTNTVSCAAAVNHHSALTRSGVHQLAPSAQHPASAFAAIMTMANDSWRSRTDPASSATSARACGVGADRLLRGRLGVGLGGDADQLLDLVVVEPG